MILMWLVFLLLSQIYLYGIFEATWILPARIWCYQLIFHRDHPVRWCPTPLQLNRRSQTVSPKRSSYPHGFCDWTVSWYSICCIWFIGLQVVTYFVLFWKLELGFGILSVSSFVALFCRYDTHDNGSTCWLTSSSWKLVWPWATRWRPFGEVTQQHPELF